MEENFINADGFLNEGGADNVGAKQTAMVVEVEKSANQQYKEYAEKEKKKGVKTQAFKEWLSKAQKDGSLKSGIEQGMSVIGDIVKIANENKNRGAPDTANDILSKIDLKEIEDKGSKKAEDMQKPMSFLGVPMPVFYIIGVGIVVVGGYYIYKSVSNKPNQNA